MGHRELGACVRDAREKAGKSQRELGDASGVGATTVRRVESGSESYEPSVRVLCAVAFALELDPADLTRAYAAVADEGLPV
jgi:transcriptional regulator with XRE-family HTH domain